MSIDLTVPIGAPIPPTQLTKGASQVLRKLLSLEYYPTIILKDANGLQNEDSRELGSKDCDMFRLLLENTGTFILITIVKNEADDEISIIFSVGPIRTDDAYVLALAAALWLANEHNSDIENGFQFWKGGVFLDPKEILERFVIPSGNRLLSEDCRLFCNLYKNQ